MYMPLLKDEEGRYIGLSHINEQNKTITFSSGARSCFTYLELDKHADNWYGSELTKIYFDEFQFRSQYQFDVLRSRNRSRAEVRKGIRCTLNPDSTHFVYEWIKPFLDSDNEFPDKSLSGRTRYYVILEGELLTDWDKVTLKNKTGKNPQTYTYIPATLDDNKFLTELDPEYRDNLDSLPEQKRKQLLLGSWAVSEDSGLYFQRGWLKRTDRVPAGATYARGWDTAAGINDKANNLSYDYTAGVKIAKCKDGNFYICGCELFQERPAPRDNKIISIALRDGEECTIVWPIDPGPHGRTCYEEFAKKAASNGLKLKSDPMPTNKSKGFKYEPFSIACQNGLVYIVESSFEPEILERFYKENELFNPEIKSSRTRHEDMCDAAASSYNYLCKARTHKIIPRNQIPSTSLSKELVENKLKY